MNKEAFNWKDKSCVVLKTQPATAVYRNNAGGVVIRQDVIQNFEEDPFVYFSNDDNVRALISALQREIGDA
jgi:predicted glycosyltransferase